MTIFYQYILFINKMACESYLSNEPGSTCDEDTFVLVKVAHGGSAIQKFFNSPHAAQKFF